MAVKRYRESLARADGPVKRARLEGKIGGVFYRQGQPRKGIEHLELGLGHLGIRAPRSRWRVRASLLRQILIQAAHTLLPWVFVRRRSKDRDAAQAAAEKALVANPQNAVAYQSAAEVRRWRAEWRLVEGESVVTELVEGQRLVEEALARNPGLASAMVTESALKTIQAEAEADSRSRAALAAEASAGLRRALEVNPLLVLERSVVALDARAVPVAGAAR